jgi:hypothetical protein
VRRTCGSGADRDGREIERDHGGSAASAAPESRGTHGDRRCDELSEGNRPTDRQPGRSLRSVSERQPARDVGRCQTLSRRPRGSGDCDPWNRRSTPIMGASRPETPSSPTISTGCKTSITGPV